MLVYYNIKCAAEVAQQILLLTVPARWGIMRRTAVQTAGSIKCIEAARENA
jgi:hypothetical protein